MGDQLVITRSRTTDQDRLYVDTAAGDPVGWVDLRTGRQEVALPERSVDFRRIVAEWRRDATVPGTAIIRQSNGVHPVPDDTVTGPGGEVAPVH